MPPPFAAAHGRRRPAPVPIRRAPLRRTGTPPCRTPPPPAARSGRGQTAQTTWEFPEFVLSIWQTRPPSQNEKCGTHRAHPSRHNVPHKWQFPIAPDLVLISIFAESAAPPASRPAPAPPGRCPSPHATPLDNHPPAPLARHLPCACAASNNTGPVPLHGKRAWSLSRARSSPTQYFTCHIVGSLERGS